MKIGHRFLLVYALVSLVCGAAQKAGAVSENFDSYADGAALGTVPGWQAPANNYAVRQNTQIDRFSTNSGSAGFPGVVYGSAGYSNSKGVETDFFANNTGGLGSQIRGALWTLTGGDVVTPNSGAVVFKAQVRLSSYAVGGTGNTNTTGAANNGLQLLIGSGFTYNAAAGNYDYTNATAFGVYFYDNGTETPPGFRVYANKPLFSDSVHGTPGFGVSNNGLTNWTSYVAGWQRDTWYTVQLSNIAFTNVAKRFATALLSVYESDNPTTMLYSNLLVRSQAGPGVSGGIVQYTNGATITGDWVSAGVFTNINQIAFGEGRINGIDTVDNISLGLATTNNPTVATHITSIVRQGDDISLTWQTSAGQTDVVQAVTATVPGTYVDISGPIVVSGSGSVATNYVETGGAVQTSRFYRVRSAP